MKAMLQSVEGVYRNGRIEFLETPAVTDGVRVIVAFLPSPSSVDLSARGINRKQAADLRARLKSFADDWDSPEMAAYDAL